LRDGGWDAWLNPHGAEAARFAVRDRTVVVRRESRKSPSAEPVATIEKLLVELCFEARDLQLMAMPEFHTMLKNLAIRASLKATREKRRSQTCKVYHVKLDRSHLSRTTREHLALLFLEAVSKGERMPIGKNVAVIGGGRAGAVGDADRQATDGELGTIEFDRHSPQLARQRSVARLDDHERNTPEVRVGHDQARLVA
jgi:hypothetical protein